MTRLTARMRVRHMQMVLERLSRLSLAGRPTRRSDRTFSQNVGIVRMTGIMSRHVITIGALFLIICGLLPKIGAVIASMPLPVLGGGVIVMFGMVAAAGLNVLSEVKMNRRNMVIIAVSLAAGLGLNLVPSAVQYLPGVVRTLMTSAVAPTALVAIALNLLLPDEV